MNFFYVLANQFVTVFLSINTLTTLTFVSEINNCDYGVSKTILDSKIRRSRTSISFIPKSDAIDTNMTCYLANGKMYVFNLKWTDDRAKAHKNIAIFDAEKKKSGRKVYEDKELKIYDAGKNYFIESKISEKNNVNEYPFGKVGVSSKWRPVFFNNREIWP